MAEQKTTVKIDVKDPVKDPAPVETIAVPKEYYSMGRAIRVEINGDQVTIDINPIIVQEIGAYHRCKVRVQYKENQGPAIIPTTIAP